MTGEPRDGWVLAGWLVLGALVLQALGVAIDVLAPERGGGRTSVAILYATASVAQSGLVPVLGALLLGAWTGRAGTALLRSTAAVAILLAATAATALVLTFFVGDNPFLQDWGPRGSMLTETVAYAVAAAVATHLAARRVPGGPPPE